MSEVNLTEDQHRIRETIQAALDRVHHIFEQHEEQERSEEVMTLMRGMAEGAHRLHIELTQSGQAPKHHKYMYENRGVPPDSLEFYEHVHPVEDLLKYLADEHANDDPEDVTIGKAFQFKVFSRRWGHDDVYHMTRTKTGWDVTYISIGGPCDKSGKPYLFANLQQDAIDYPAGLGGWLEWLWHRAKEDGLTAAQVQSSLDQLAQWVRNTEQSSPNGGVWEGYK